MYIAWLREVAESVPPPGPIADHVLPHEKTHLWKKAAALTRHLKPHPCHTATGLILDQNVRK